MVVKACDGVVVGSAVEDLADLLQEALPVELCGAGKSVLSQQDMLALQSGVETIFVITVKKLTSQ